MEISPGRRHPYQSVIAVQYDCIPYWLQIGIRDPAKGKEHVLSWSANPYNWFNDVHTVLCIHIYIIFSICNKKSNERTKVPIEGSQNIIKDITVSQTAAETMWSPTEEDERWLEARITLLTVALPVDDLSQIGAWIPVWRCLAFNVWV